MTRIFMLQSNQCLVLFRFLLVRFVVYIVLVKVVSKLVGIRGVMFVKLAVKPFGTVKIEICVWSFIAYLVTIHCGGDFWI